MDTSPDHLREVFDLLDSEGKGYITVDQFRMTFEQFYHSTDHMKRRISSPQKIDILVKSLDPQNDGVIYFDAFTKAFPGNNFLDTPSTLNSATSTNKSACFSDGPDNKTDDSGVHVHDSNIYDFDNESSLSVDAVHSHPNRDESWTKHRFSLSKIGNAAHLSHPLNLGSPSSISRSDINVDFGESDLEMLRDQLRRMEQRMEHLHSSQSSGIELRMNALRDENTRLAAQVTIMEERLREADSRGQRNVESERQHLQSIINRNQERHTSEMETIKNRVKELERECEERRAETAELKANKKEYSSERQRDTEALSDAQDQIKELRTQLDTIESKYRKEMDVLRQDRDHAVHVLEELNTSTGGRRKSRAGSITGTSDFMARYQESQEIVRRLLGENKTLRIQLEDANDQLFARSIEEGRTLISPTQKSWATEIDKCTKEEVIEMWTREKAQNDHLRQYIDKLTIRIIERYPSLLDVTASP